MGSFKIIRARRLIDGTGRDPIDYPVVVVKNSKIVQAGVESDVDIPLGDSVEEVNITDGAILPGLIDSHVRARAGGSHVDGVDSQTIPGPSFLLLVDPDGGIAPGVAHGVGSVRRLVDVAGPPGARASLRIGHVS